jgi:uncharacterized protein (UPF0276 family)
MSTALHRLQTELSRYPTMSVPARAGVGLKLEHTHDILAGASDIGWFEVHPENYMGDGGPPHHFLERIRADYPIALHGVGLSIGSAGPLSTDHLQRLQKLVRRYEPGLFSEHLAWSTHDGIYMNDLLPLPYNRETLALVADHVDEVQATLKRQMLIENPSTYMTLDATEMSELQFLGELARRTGCGLLFDVNNLFVCATNHHFDPEPYIDAFPVALIGEIHLAGHAELVSAEHSTLLVDSHDRCVADPVWRLYERLIARSGPKPTLIEWDNDVPAFGALAAEARGADQIMAQHSTKRVSHAV